MAAASEMERIRLTLRNDLAELDRLAGWIERWADHTVPADTSFALQVCLEEAVANIIMHGRIEEPSSEIAVELEHDGAMLHARVDDCGTYFDPIRFPPPTSATSLASAKVGDLGIHLMRSFATGMSYERRGRCNRVTFWFAPSQSGGCESANRLDH